MRQKIAIRLLSSAALAAILSLGALSSVRAEDVAKPDDASPTVMYVRFF